MWESLDQGCFMVVVIHSSSHPALLPGANLGNAGPFVEGRFSFGKKMTILMTRWVCLQAKKGPWPLMGAGEPGYPSPQKSIPVVYFEGLWTKESKTRYEVSKLLSSVAKAGYVFWATLRQFHLPVLPGAKSLDTWSWNPSWVTAGQSLCFQGGFWLWTLHPPMVSHAKRWRHRVGIRSRRSTLIKVSISPPGIE